MEEENQSIKALIYDLNKKLEKNLNIKILPTSEGKKKYTKRSLEKFINSKNQKYSDILKLDSPVKNGKYIALF